MLSSIEALEESSGQSLAFFFRVLEIYASV